jgi:hypothetical protein
MITKKDLDDKLKKDAESNRFKVDGDFIVFDKNSNLDYQILESFKLRELLTANKVSTTTRLNKNLLVSLNKIRETYGRPIAIRASYHSPEYHLTSFGCHNSDLYTSGNALSLGVDHLNELLQTVNEMNWPGELGIYKWGIHLGYSKTSKSWDLRNVNTTQQKVKDIITNDSMKNWLMIGGAAVAAWFLFIKKK